MTTYTPNARLNLPEKIEHISGFGLYNFREVKKLKAKKPTYKPCGHCDGSGVISAVIFQEPYDMALPISANKKCPICKGSGKVRIYYQDKKEES